MLKIEVRFLLLIILINYKTSAGPLKSKAAKVIVDDVAFYKLGTYREFIKLLSNKNRV